MKALITTFLILFSIFAHADIYKWTDKNGKVHFSDEKPKQGSSEKVEPNAKINSYTNVTYDVVPYSPNPAAKSSKKVVMYSASWCGYCKKARKYFQANNIPFSEKDIETSNVAKREYDALGGRGVPVILVGKKRMNGFSDAGFSKLYKM